MRKEIGKKAFWNAPPCHSDTTVQHLYSDESIFAERRERCDDDDDDDG